ncbi:MAG: NAD(P)H-dependent oxidoreductase, partial [Azovibrio sp.]
FTLGGRPHMFGPEAIHGEMEVMLRPLLRGTLAYVGFEVLPPFVAWHVPYISQEEREDYLVRYQDYLMNLDSLTPLGFPSISNFDEKMMPKAEHQKK